MKMTMPTKVLATAVVAAAIPLALPATAAPLSQSLALTSTDVGAVEQVQYRRWHRRGYYAYARGYYGRGLAWNYGNGSAATQGRRGCPADREIASGYPSWLCR